jgi:hypothetical protein
MHPETKHGCAPGKAGGGKKAKDPEFGSLETFIQATVKATGKGKTTVSLDAERGEKINGKALDALSGTPLDKGVYLDQLKTIPVERQLSVVENDLAKIDPPKIKRDAPGRYRSEYSPITRADTVAFWITSRIDKREISSLINLLEGTQVRSIIAGLQHSTSLGRPLFLSASVSPLSWWALSPGNWGVFRVLRSVPPRHN